jgi:hypothetical protein
MTRRGILRSLLVALALGGGAALLVLKVPALREEARARWHAWRCPALPPVHTTFDPDEQPLDPWPVYGNGPSLHAELTGTSDTALTDDRSPAVVRRVGDVADSLVSIGFGVELRSPDPDPDLRLCLRIDAPDGTNRAWNEKRLRADEHVPGAMERFNFEWILRDMRVAPDDRVAAFVHRPGHAPVALHRVDLVFRSAAPLTNR